MGLIRDFIKDLKSGVRDNVKPQKNDEPKHDNHPTKVDNHAVESKSHAHHAAKADHKEPVHHQEKVDYHDVESKGQTSNVEATPVSDEEQKKEAKKFKRMKIIALVGIITSIIALANAIETKERNGLIIANVVLTFTAAVLNFAEYYYLKKTGRQVPLSTRYFIHFVIMALNLAGVGVCIALLVTLGASYGWIVTLIFHVVIVVMNVAYFWKGDK